MMKSRTVNMVGGVPGDKRGGSNRVTNDIQSSRVLYSSGSFTKPSLNLFLSNSVFTNIDWPDEKSYTCTTYLKVEEASRRMVNTSEKNGTGSPTANVSRRYPVLAPDATRHMSVAKDLAFLIADLDSVRRSAEVTTLVVVTTRAASEVMSRPDA